MAGQKKAKESIIMATRLNPKWVDEIKTDADALKKAISDGTDREDMDITLSYNKAAQFLIAALSLRSIPFKIYNLGAGVKRITTETDNCPCCKRKLK